MDNQIAWGHSNLANAERMVIYCSEWTNEGWINYKMLDFTMKWGDSQGANVCAGIKREKESRHRIFDLDGIVHIQDRGVASQMHKMSI